MKCQKCGKEIEDNMKFCRFCGAEQKKKSNHWHLVMAVVLLGIVAAGLTVTAVFLFQKNRGGSKDPETFTGSYEQEASLTGNEIESSDVANGMTEPGEMDTDITGYGTETKQLYEKYVKDVLEPKFGIADKAPFVQMWRQTMEWADFTVGSAEKNRGILTTAYVDLSGDDIDEMIVLVSERLKEPKFNPSDGGDYDTSYYEFYDAVSVYIYGIRDQQVEQLMTDTETEALRTYPLSNAYGCTYKYMTVTREGKNYLLIVGSIDYWYGTDSLEYALIGEENGQVRCLAGRCFMDGQINDLITGTEISTPSLPEAENVQLDRQFYEIYAQPLTDRGIAPGSLSSYFDGLYTAYDIEKLEDSGTYPVFDDYPDDADMIMDLQCRYIRILVPDFEETFDVEQRLSFACYVISEDRLNSEQITSVNWRNIVSEYLAENRTSVQLPDSEIENEVKRIRQVWTEDRGNVSNQVFDKVEPQKGIRLYYQNGDLKMIEADKNVFDGYSRIFQIENGKLTFAYYESAAEQIRLYFYEESLFRWIQTNAGSDAVTHDNERDNSQFAAYEQMALNDVKKILN